MRKDKEKKKLSYEETKEVLKFLITISITSLSILVAGFSWGSVKNTSLWYFILLSGLTFFESAGLFPDAVSKEWRISKSGVYILVIPTVVSIIGAVNSLVLSFIDIDPILVSLGVKIPSNVPTLFFGSIQNIVILLIELIAVFILILIFKIPEIFDKIIEKVTGSEKHIGEGKEYEMDRLSVKYQIIEFSKKRLDSAVKRHSEKVGETEFRRGSGEDIIKIQKEVIFYTEAFFFETKSFLDILIRKMLGRSKVNNHYITFRKHSLKELKPQDKFKSKLNEFWHEGLNKRKYSLSNLKNYRDIICHDDYLRFMLGKYEGDTFNEYVLPDDPDEERENYTFNKNIQIFEFCDEAFKMIKKILGMYVNGGYQNKKYNLKTNSE